MISFSIVVIERDDSNIGSKVRAIDNIFPIYDSYTETLEFVKDNRIVETFRMDCVESVTLLVNKNG